MFKKILIANRGEIACRVAATARRLGVRTVAVYSDADAGSRHVSFATRPSTSAPARRATVIWANGSSTRPAPAAPRPSHPGYGFLARTSPCQRLRRHGLVFIGPPADAMAAMGSKSAAKTLMGQAGVPLVPGYHGADTREADADPSTRC